MGFKEIISKLGAKNKERKEILRRMDDQMRMEEILINRRKSANERELERYDDEDREESIKERLEYMRKKRDRDIKFNHNALDVKNITTHTEWEVLKEPNVFAGKNNRSMFANQKFIHKNDSNLLKNNKALYGI